MKIRKNENGRRIGEGHGRAVWPDDVIDLAMRLKDRGLSSASVARALGMPASTLRSVVSGKARCQQGRA